MLRCVVERRLDSTYSISGPCKPMSFSSRPSPTPSPRWRLHCDRNRKKRSVCGEGRRWTWRLGGGDSGLRDPVTTLLLTLKLGWHLNVIELKNRPLKIQSSLSCRKLLWRMWLPRGSCVYSWTGLRTLSPDSWLPSPSATSRLADLATRAG